MVMSEAITAEVETMLAIPGAVPPAESGALLLEEDLLRVGRNDGEAFCRLYEQTKGSVYAYALSFLRDHSEAEDVMQDVYLKVRAAAHLYRPQGKPLAWILTITANLCRMRLRQNRHRSYAEPQAVAPDWGRIEDVGDRLALQAAMKALSEEEYRIIVLHAVSGFKHREIASFLDIPLSTVLSKYRRALKKLRQELEGSR